VVLGPALTLIALHDPKSGQQQAGYVYWGVLCTAAHCSATQGINGTWTVDRSGATPYLVLNDEVGRAAAQLASIVSAERARRERQEWVARRVLATFT